MNTNRLFSIILIGCSVLLLINGLRSILSALPIRSIFTAIKQGTIRVNTDTTIARVDADSPAQQAGLQVGDIIRSINNTPINTITATKLLRENRGKNIEMTIERATRMYTVSLIPRIQYPTGEGPAGLVLSSEGEKHGTPVGLLSYLFTHHVSWAVEQPAIFPPGPIGILLNLREIDLFYPLIFLIGLFTTVVGIGLLRRKRWAVYCLFAGTSISILQILFIIVRYFLLPALSLGMLLLEIGIDGALTYYFYKHLHLFR